MFAILPLVAGVLSGGKGGLLGSVLGKKGLLGGLTKKLGGLFGKKKKSKMRQQNQAQMQFGAPQNYGRIIDEFGDTVSRGFGRGLLNRPGGRGAFGLPANINFDDPLVPARRGGMPLARRPSVMGPLMDARGRPFCEPGYHISYKVRGREGMPTCVRNRRMNPLNFKALKHSSRRLEAFEKTIKRVFRVNHLMPKRRHSGRKRSKRWA